ncbi:unnamed protein product [Durusdinium trenchii]|uniref:Magnesium transporter MgtE intracellular domain-containing protein n=1 Tax=Durusdinium trenchii TaxID=1381693 RepID=A0ABP0JX98_9DINO
MQTPSDDEEEVAAALEARLQTLDHLSTEEAAMMLQRMDPAQASQLVLLMGSSKRSGVLEVMPKVSGATKALADVIEKDIPVGPACKHVPVAPSSLEGSLWVFYTCIMSFVESS